MHFHYSQFLSCFYTRSLCFKSINDYMALSEVLKIQIFCLTGSLAKLCKMLPDLVKITGLSIFEILLQSVGLIVFLGMLALKLENIYNITWWYVFCPLLVANGLCLYFSFIVFIRSYNSQSHKTGAYKRAIWILLAYSLLIVHEVCCIDFYMRY